MNNYSGIISLVFWFGAWVFVYAWVRIWICMDMYGYVGVCTDKHVIFMLCTCTVCVRARIDMNVGVVSRPFLLQCTSVFTSREI